MTVYEIDNSIAEILANGIDEDGCITDEALEALNQLQQERDTKIENIACYIINLSAEAKAIREQEKILAERRKAAEKKSERLEGYLKQVLNGEKFSSSKVTVSYRKSKSLEIPKETEYALFGWLIDNGIYHGYNAETVYKFDKTLLKTKLANLDCPYAKVVENSNMTIK